MKILILALIFGLSLGFRLSYVENYIKCLKDEDGFKKCLEREAAKAKIDNIDMVNKHINLMEKCRKEELKNDTFIEDGKTNYVELFGAIVGCEIRGIFFSLALECKKT